MVCVWVVFQCWFGKSVLDGTLDCLLDLFSGVFPDPVTLLDGFQDGLLLALGIHCGFWYGGQGCTHGSGIGKVALVRYELKRDAALRLPLFSWWK